MLWLCINLPALPLEIFTRHQARHFYQNQGSGKIIVEQQHIVNVNNTARTFGLNRGMPINAAYAICDDVEIKQRDLEKEQLALTELSHWAYQISPRVSIYKHDSLMLEIGSVLKSSGGLNTILSTLEEDLSTMGYSYQFGLAHTPKAAELAVRTNPNSCKYFDSTTQRFNTVAYKAALNSLPLSELKQSLTVERKFKQLGLANIGDLMPLPVSTLAQNFGQGFLRFLAELRGDIHDPQEAIKAPNSFSRSFFFNRNVEHVGGLRFPMRRLLSELTNYLTQHQWHCQSIEWRLVASNEKVESIVINLPTHCNQYDTLFEISQKHLEKLNLHTAIEQMSLHGQQFSSMKNTTEVSASGAHDEPLQGFFAFDEMQKSSRQQQHSR